MNDAWKSVGRGLEWFGVVLLIVASVPIIAITAFLLRAMLVVAAIVGVVGVTALYFTYPRFRLWADQHAGWTRRRQLHLM